jgi:hypothetical protein
MAMDRDKWRIITGAVKAGTQLWNQRKICEGYDKQEMETQFSLPKPRGKRSLGRPRCGCKHKIKMDLGVKWIELTQDMVK